MKYNKLTEDIDVSIICLGTMTFGEQNTESEAHEQMDFALGQGVNFWDTAELYAVPSNERNNGKTEAYIGTWFEKTKKRDQVVLATKVTGPSQNLKYISENLGFSKPRIREAVEGSLRRLRTDYIDLYQLHWPERKTNVFGQRGFKKAKDETWTDNFLDVIKTMNDLIDEGKIRHWGLSNETPWGTMRFLHEADQNNLRRPISIQNPYSLLNRQYEIGMAEISVRENIGLLAYSPLAMGMLSGKYNKGTDKPEHRLNKYKYFSRYSSPTVKAVTQDYLNVAEENNLTLTQMALAYVNTREFTTANIIGATRLEQLKENIDSVNIRLDDEVVKRIDRIHNRMPDPAP